jgi:hypothetical protein
MHVAVSPTYPVDELVFAGLGSRVLQPMRRTREVRSGNVLPLWSDSAIPAAPITTLAASPRYDEDRTLFVGTSAGVYVSSDGGRRFVSWSEGLTPPGIVALSAEARLVYAIGFGGTLWSRERPPRR